MASPFDRQSSIRRSRRPSERSGTKVPERSGKKLPEKAARVVAAIDFGTTGTGYAYYIPQEGRGRLEGIVAQQAWLGGTSTGLQAPTTLLMTPEGEFDSFGFEAETKYEQLALRNEHKSWFFFRHFKMTLHHRQELYIDMELGDINNKQMMAMDVFICAIKYVKEHLYKKIEQAHGSGLVDPENVQWVLTVPAIWRESAKQFMRAAAQEAGIPEKLLTLALEPESAAIFCKEQAVSRTQGTDGVLLKSFDPGETFLVLDIGGGTVDTTVHEVKTDGRLYELHAATGGAWGGELVNKAFEELIKDLVSSDVFDKYKEDNASDWIEVRKRFEDKKRQFTGKEDTVIQHFTVGLDDVYQRCMNRNLEIPDGLIADKYMASFKRGALILPPETMRLLFQKAIGPIIEHIRALLEEPKLKQVSSILLVGCFAESSIVNKCIDEEFPHINVYTPPNASSAILRGAVLFGLNQDVIAVRVSPFTYGVRSRKLYNPRIHSRHRAHETNGERRVMDVFSKHIEKGQPLYVNHPSEGKSYTIKRLKTLEIFMTIFQSNKEAPQFCNESGCKEIGRLSFKIPKTMVNKVLSFKVWMTCKGTELHVQAKIDGLQGNVSVKLDFLSSAKTCQSEEDITEIS